MTRALRPDDQDLDLAIRSALITRAQGVIIAPADIHERVAAARRIATGSPGGGRSVRLAVIALVIAIGLVLALAIGGGSTPIPTTSPTPSAESSASPLAVAGARDPTGIPETWGGQPVEIGLAAIVHAKATTDAAPFLLGGWLDDGSGHSCSEPIDKDPSPLLSGCATFALDDVGLMYWDGRRLPNSIGPSIVKVHTHDPRSAACRPDSQAKCLAVIVVDEVLWTGDTWTATAPLSVHQALAGAAGAMIRQYVGTSGVDGAWSFETANPDPCPSPWPHEVYEIHGDPGYGMVAVFPDEGSRVAAQASLDPATPGCAVDGRVVRPAAPHWLGVANVLVLLYGLDLDREIKANLAGETISDQPWVGLPAASLDESYRTVDDAEAARASGLLDALNTIEITNVTGDVWLERYLADSYRRFAANALTYVIGPARIPTAADMSADQWVWLKKYGVPGMSRLFDVDHPASTDPTLAHETLVAYEAGRTWLVLLVQPPDLGPSGAPPTESVP